MFDDADVEAAAEAIAAAGYFNAGQDCTAATRVLAGPGVHEDFVAALTEQARDTKTGQPDDEDVLYGPVNNADQLARVGGFIERLPDHAELQAGGSRVGRQRATSSSRPWSPVSSKTTRPSRTRSSAR